MHMFRSLFILSLLLFATPALAGDPLHKDGGPQLSSKAVLVLDTQTGKVLLARNATDERSIASLTKLQAALVLMDTGLKLDQGTAISREDHKVGLKGCRTRLELKWIYKNRDLLHAALMASDNRAVSALGRAVGLHANALVQAMNERARREGLKKTVFKGPVGIDHGNVSTAWEVARIARAASKNKALSAIMKKSEYTVKPVKGYLKIVYKNTNPVVGAKNLHFLASKTGYNSSAGYCLATVVKARGLGTITVVLLGASAKYGRVSDLKKILRWLKAGGKQS